MSSAPPRFTTIHNNNYNNIRTLSTSVVPGTIDLRESVRNQTDVSLRMTKHLFQTKANGKNMVYSPLSIHTLLSLTAAGTKGATQDELLSFLKSKSTAELNSLASNLVPLVFANGSPAAGVPKQVDFQNKAEEARTEVNSWAAKETKGLITEVLPSGTVNSSTRLILANALYFKGAWDDDPFDGSKTKDYVFHLLNGRSNIKAPFMTSRNEQFIIKAFDGFKVLKLPYKRGKDEQRRFCMCLVLPDEKDGLPALVERVCSEPGFLDRHIPRCDVEVGDFRIPKFKITSGFKVCDILKQLGLELPFLFDPYKGGNLTEMVESPPGEDPFVSVILQGAVIEVNEEGTEAAAVTAFVKKQGSKLYKPRKKIDFVADHPFLFFIREEMTGAVLFIGQLLNPLQD
ncbi:serpin-ZX-like [Prunus yedoensis var. nudiflora]|uniref:Serpin-ZX-like n=1 Tax=Prunus yedoensis var. nudiflora TaxID=2094558 RepID=A0A314XLW9_PRUYE|nr:serpin-ZX-like [Prunus yedoensis var. nudiflora]